MIDSVLVNMDAVHLLTGMALRKNQIIAMILKRTLSTYRSLILSLIQIFVPVTFIVMAMLVARNMDMNKDLPSLPITLDSYENPITVVNGTNQNDYYKSYIEIINKEGKILKDLQQSDLAQEIVYRVTDLKHSKEIFFRIRFNLFFRQQKIFQCLEDGTLWVLHLRKTIR